MTSVVIASLMPRQPKWGAAVSHEFLTGILVLLAEGKATNIPIVYDRLDYGMQAAAEAFLTKTTDDALLLLPHTHRLPEWGLERLLERDKPIVAPLSWEVDTAAPRVYTQGQNGVMGFHLNLVGEAMAAHLHESQHGATLLPDFDGALVTEAHGVLAVGAPLLIRRAALIAMTSSEWFTMSGELPEFAFWDRARQAGWQPWLDLSVVCDSGGMNHQTFLEQYGEKVA